jgi:hypothetical protein
MSRWLKVSLCHCVALWRWLELMSVWLRQQLEHAAVVSGDFGRCPELVLVEEEKNAAFVSGKNFEI